MPFTKSFAWTKSFSVEASYQTRSARNSSIEISTFMQFTDKLFESRLQIFIPRFFQPANRAVHAVINAEFQIVLENMNVPASMVGKRELENVACVFAAHGKNQETAQLRIAFCT